MQDFGEPIKTDALRLPQNRARAAEPAQTGAVRLLTAPREESPIEPALVLTGSTDGLLGSGVVLLTRCCFDTGIFIR
jgi:hypothetical protein